MEQKPRPKSERPVRRDQVKSLPIIRPPYRYLLTPGLDRSDRVDAIGFTARPYNEVED